MVQLFVIPAVVVAVVIVVWLLFGKLAGGERDAMEYVRQLRLSSANWRSAFELASLIQNDAKLGSDPKLLGELTDLLSHELDHNENPRLTQYVALTLGAFQTLDASLADGRKVDPIEPLARALEPKFETPIRIAAAASLAKQAARLQGKLDDPRGVAALAQAAAGDDPELRQMAVYALGFFGGEAASQALRDRITGDEDRYVRYNAAVALGRRGDMAAKGTLSEMLSTTALDRVIELPSKTGKAEQDRGHRARGPPGDSVLAVERVARACPLAPTGNRGPDPVGPGRCPEPGPGGVAKITNRPLMARRHSRRALARPFRSIVRIAQILR